MRMNLMFRFHFSICAPSWQWEFVPRTASKLPKVNDHSDHKFSSTYMKSVHSWNVHISSEERLVIIKYTLPKTTMPMENQHFEDVNVSPM